MEVYGVKADGKTIQLLGRPEAITHAWKSLYGLPVVVNGGLQEPTDKVSYHTHLWICLTDEERHNVFQVLRECFKSYQNIDYKAWRPKYYQCITARLRGTIISVATITGECMIENLATKEMHTQKGHARQIVKKAIELCEEGQEGHDICLRVAKIHDRDHFLHSLYASLHFQLTHETFHYYHYTYSKVSSFK